MPKLKTHSSAKKRFSVTGSGKVKRTRSGKRHILTKKEKSRKLRLGHAALVVDADMPRMRRLLVI
jgi:large subunit ribosomal protein L35